MNSEALKRAAILPPGAFRLLLAAAVVVSHVSRLDVGRLGVLLFFYLSGYWVARIWQGEFEGRRWGSFYASRWLRIAPLYYLAMFAAALALDRPIGLENLTLLGAADTDRDPTGVSWSLDIELQFYLLLPILAAFASNRRLVLPGLVLLTALGWWLHARFGWRTAPMYLPAFALGTLNAKTRWNPGTNVAIASLVGFLALTALFAAIPYTLAFLDKRAADPFELDAFSMVWMLPLLPYVAASLAVRSSPLDRDVGNWSYPLYLIHVPLIAFCVAHGQTKWLGVGLALILALALFYGPDRLFERGRRWLISVPRQPALVA